MYSYYRFFSIFRYEQKNKAVNRQNLKEDLYSNLKRDFYQKKNDWKNFGIFLNSDSKRLSFYSSLNYLIV